MDQGWLKVKSAAKYCDMGERTVRDWLKDGLPHAKLPSGTVLIKRDWIDAFLANFKTTNDETEKIVDDILKTF
jgi:hypothetical protein